MIARAIIAPNPCARARVRPWSRRPGGGATRRPGFTAYGGPSAVHVLLIPAAVNARTRSVAALSLVVAVVLGDSGVVTLALPEILRDFGSEVGEVAWVLIAFNLVLALAAVPAARVCVRRDPAVATAAGLTGF